MTIMRDGKDVTAQVFTSLEARRAANPLQAQHIIMLLTAARDELNRIPTPWLYDCISDSINEIDGIIRKLKNP